MYCTECGAEIYEGDMFCRNCRTRIGQPGPEGASPANPTPTPIPTPVTGQDGAAVTPGATIIDTQQPVAATIIDTPDPAAGAGSAGAAAAGVAGAAGATATGPHTAVSTGPTPFDIPASTPGASSSGSYNPPDQTYVTDLAGYSSKPSKKSWLPYAVVAAVLVVVIIIVVMIMSSGTSGHQGQPAATSPAQNASSTSNSATNASTPAAADIAKLAAGTVLSPDEVARNGVDSYFTISEISNKLYKRMKGKTYSKKSPVQKENLRYIRCLHKNEEGQILIGEIVVSKDVANDVLNIFRELYDASFPIQKMVLPDDYGGDNDASMADDNTTAYNYRTAAGSNSISSHAYGTAIDVNPLYNPYYIIKTDDVYPPAGRQYLNRNASFPYKITAGDICVRTFEKYGFVWSGNNAQAPDYQHFEKRF